MSVTMTMTMTLTMTMTMTRTIKICYLTIIYKLKQQFTISIECLSPCLNVDASDEFLSRLGGKAVYICTRVVLLGAIAVCLR